MAVELVEVARLEAAICIGIVSITLVKDLSGFVVNFEQLFLSGLALM